MKFIPAFLSSVLVLVNACKSQPQNVDGGPCSYTEEILPATVVEVYPTEADSSQFEVTFAIEQFGEPDTIYYSSHFPTYLPHKQVDSLQVKPGNQFSWVHKSISSGHCSPDIFVLRMEPFKPAN